MENIHKTGSDLQKSACFPPAPMVQLRRRKRTVTILKSQAIGMEPEQGEKVWGGQVTLLHELGCSSPIPLFAPSLAQALSTEQEVWCLPGTLTAHFAFPALFEGPAQKKKQGKGCPGLKGVWRQKEGALFSCVRQSSNFCQPLSCVSNTDTAMK